MEVLLDPKFSKWHQLPNFQLNSKLNQMHKVGVWSLCYTPEWAWPMCQSQWNRFRLYVWVSLTERGVVFMCQSLKKSLNSLKKVWSSPSGNVASMPIAAFHFTFKVCFWLPAPCTENTSWGNVRWRIPPFRTPCNIASTDVCYPGNVITSNTCVHWVNFTSIKLNILIIQRWVKKLSAAWLY